MQSGRGAGSAGWDVRTLTSADVDRLEALRQQAGFNQTVEDWQRLLRLEPEGCFAAVDGDRVIGSVTTTVYSDRLAWIGMVIVDLSFRRLGVASGLVERALDYLAAERSVNTVALDATPAGKAVYDRLGFDDQYRVHRLQGVAPRTVAGSDLVGSRRMTREDLVVVAELDSAVVGAVRTRLIEELFMADPPGCSVVEVHGRITAWSFRRPGADRWHIGPVVGLDERSVEIALRSALAGVPGEDIEIDAIEGAWPLRLAERFELSVVRSFVRMSRGRSLPTSGLATCCATAAPELG